MSEQRHSAALDDLADWVAAYRAAREHERNWRETAERVRAEITTRLSESEASVGTVAGSPVVRYTPVTTQRLDTKALREDHPELAARYTAPQTSHRFSLVDGAGGAA